MKCLDQNGVKHLWNCIFNNAVSKSDVDLSANMNSLNPISNNAVCNHVGSIAESLRNSKADYEEGTCTLTICKMDSTNTYEPDNIIDSKAITCSYIKIGKICYVNIPHAFYKWDTNTAGYFSIRDGFPFTPKDSINHISKIGIENTAFGTNRIPCPTRLPTNDYYKQAYNFGSIATKEGIYLDGVFIYEIA